MTRLLTLAALALMFAIPAARAAELEPYTPGAMASAQAEGKPVILHVTASWCSTCAAQKPIVRSLLENPKFRNLVVLDVDFDTQKKVLHKYDVRMQSSFLAFKGKEEVGRSTGDTDRASIKRLFDKTS